MPAATGRCRLFSPRTVTLVLAAALTWSHPVEAAGEPRQTLGQSSWLSLDAETGIGIGPAFYGRASAEAKFWPLPWIGIGPRGWWSGNFAELPNIGILSPPRKTVAQTGAIGGVIALRRAAAGGNVVVLSGGLGGGYLACRANCSAGTKHIGWDLTLGAAIAVRHNFDNFALFASLRWDAVLYREGQVAANIGIGFDVGRREAGP